MRTRFGANRRSALGVTLTALVAIVAASAVPGAASAVPDGGHGRSDHWGVITRNTIGSPVAALRNGPFGSFGVQDQSGRPPFGHGSLGIEVADNSTSLSPPSEAVHFGNEVDFYGDPVLKLHQVGFHVFRTGENVGYGGASVNMPNIRFEINPNLNPATSTATYSSMVWNPPASPVTNRWSGYLDATTTGTWWLTGSAGPAIHCALADNCDFQTLLSRLDDGGAEPVIYTAGVSKGRDFMWIGAVDGLRINRAV
ncbi:hypothetical protein [Streptomyces sp. GbtcB6]|uniref:hypothetical protein n=1 Tax=Streptomyces sp. GbtcB6 TaxID=2824751 RepID=UPI001C2F9633|nr:hypothetical protein [Streptomyces sp. GbtcB6]